MTTPAWNGATSGQQPLAGQINQFLGAHSSALVYSGAVVQSSRTTVGSGSVASNGLWIAQQFTTGASQTAIGRVDIDLQPTGVTGAQLSPAVIGIYANSGGAPSGSALVSTLVPAEYFPMFGAYTYVPMPVSGLTANTVYWLVVQAAGNATYYYPWLKSNQTSGASTSPDGVTWTAQSYGLLYKVYDDTAAGSVLFTWEDSGARWTYTPSNAQGTPSTLSEYTAAQAAGDYVFSSRNFAYTNGLLTSVS